jgi:HlyD family secretion protein
MTKKLFIIAIIILIVILWLIALLTNNSTKESDIPSGHAQIRNISDIRLISGVVIPKQKISLKAPITGVIEKIYVKLGDRVNKGDPVVKIKLLSNPNTVENAKRSLVVAQSNFEATKRNFERNKSLHDLKVITDSEYEEYYNKWQLVQEELSFAKKQLEISNTGYIKGQKTISNVVYSTINGTVLELPLVEGASVVERNNFNDGTAVAVIADMNNMIFKGKVSEADVQHLFLNMPFEISLNAISDKQYPTTLSKISPEGNSEEKGMTKFDIEGNVKVDNASLTLRSGFTAVAKLILSERKNVLSIQEKFVYFSDDSAYVYVINGNVKRKRLIKTGLSDGIYIQITKGLDKKEKIAINTDDL